MKCPRDRHDLDSQAYWAHPRHRCPACDGMLLGESGVMATLGHGRGTTFGTAAGVRVGQLPVGPLLCPRDAKRMHVLVYQGVELDICPACRSIWLDRGEHEKIAAMRKDKGDVDLGSPGDGDVGFDVDGVLDFVGDALGSLLDGL